MKTTILNGSTKNDITGERIRTALTAQLQMQGWDVEHFALCEQKIGNCAGDFFCWIRTPGVCNVKDDNRTIAAAAVASDLMIFLTPIAFGGYGSTLKGMVDHLIQNISPFFTKIADETHHFRRYKKNPDLLVIGWQDSPDAQAEAVFRHLVERNAINFHAKTRISGVVLTSQSDEEIEASVQQWVDDLRNGRSSPHTKLPVNNHTSNKPTEVQRALLLVGSPKTRKSTSNSLGDYLFEQLRAQSIQTETIYLHTVLRNPQKMQALLDATDMADLVTLAFPLYVDALPAPVAEALERIAEHRQNHAPSRRQLFTAIANCGFPEAHQCNTALAICETFARKARFEWAGALALGAGSMVNGMPLAEAGGMTIRIRQSLALAAEQLAQGQTVPAVAQEMMSKPVVPHWVYRLMGGLGWIQSARGYGVLKLLWQRPYLAKAS